MKKNDFLSQEQYAYANQSDEKGISIDIIAPLVKKEFWDGSSWFFFATEYYVDNSTVTLTGQATGSGNVNGSIAVTLANNLILPGTGGTTLPGGTTAQRAGGAGTIRFNSQLGLFESTVDGSTWLSIDTAGGTVTSVATSGFLTGGPITSTGTISIGNSTANTLLGFNGSGVAANITAGTNITISGGVISSTNTGGTVTSIATGIGLTGGPITSSGTISLANTVVTPGSYTNGSFTVDQQGRLTAASSGTSPIISISGTANRISVTGTTSATIDIASTYVGQTSITTLGTIGTGTWHGSIISGTYGGTGVNNGSNTITLAGNLVTSGAFSLTLTTTASTNVTLPTSGTLVNTAVTTLSSLASIGTITIGTWNGSIISGTYGGTGINNGSKTITLGGNLTTSGAFNSTFTMTGTTNVTFPTSGTLSTTTGTVTSLTAGTAITLSPSTITSTGSISVSTNPAFSGNASAASFNANGSTQNAYKYLLSGQEYFDSSYTSTNGIALVLGMNRDNYAGPSQNWREFWLLDSSLMAKNSTNPVIKFGFYGSTTYIDTHSTNGTTAFDLKICGGGGTLVLGGNLNIQGTEGTGDIINGRWKGTMISGQYGGTGANNGSKIITLGGNLTTSGAFNTTLTATADTNVTLPTSGTLVNTAVTTLSSLASIGTITTGTWNGSAIGLSYGGLNANLTASNGGIFYSTASAGAILAGTATAGQMLRSGSSAAPSWSTATYPATTTINQLLYSSAANTIAGLATGNNGVLVTDGSGVPSISSTLPSAVQGNITSLGALSSLSVSGTSIFISNSATAFQVNSNISTNIFKVDGAVPRIWSQADHVCTTGIRPVGDGSTGGTCGASGNRWATVWAANGTIQTSDFNEKKNIKQSELGLTFIKKLKPKSWNWKDENLGLKEHYGFVFEDVQAIAPENFGALYPSEKVKTFQYNEKTKGYSETSEVRNSSHGLNYSSFIGPMVKAIQELSEKLAHMEARFGSA